MGKNDVLFDKKELQTSIDLAVQMGTQKAVNINSAEDIQDRINLYFMACREYGIAPDVAGLANALGLKRKELLQLAETGTSDPRIEIISRALTQINAIISSLSKKSIINPTMTIMDLANDFGYSRQGDVIIEKPRDERIQNAEQIAQKYAGLLEDKSIVDAEVIEKKPRKSSKAKKCEESS